MKYSLGVTQTHKPELPTKEESLPRQDVADGLDIESGQVQKYERKQKGRPHIPLLDLKRLEYKQENITDEHKSGLRLKPTNPLDINEHTVGDLSPKERLNLTNPPDRNEHTGGDLSPKEKLIELLKEINSLGTFSTAALLTGTHLALGFTQEIICKYNQLGKTSEFDPEFFQITIPISTVPITLVKIHALIHDQEDKQLLRAIIRLCLPIYSYMFPIIWGNDCYAPQRSEYNQIDNIFPFVWTFLMFGLCCFSAHCNDKSDTDEN